MSASLRSRAIEALAVHTLNMLPTGSDAAAGFESAIFDQTRVTGARAKTAFYLAPSPVVLAAIGIDAGRGSWFADGVFTSGHGRDTLGLDSSVKATEYKGRLPSSQSVDLGSNNSGLATKARGERGDALIVTEVVGRAGTFPEGNAGPVVGTEVVAVRFHRIDSLIAGDVPYYLTDAGERIAHKIPAGASTIEDRTGHRAWFRPSDGYWRLRCTIDASTAISGWMTPAEAAEFGSDLAAKHGRKAKQRNGASHRFDSLRLWASTGEVRVNGRTDSKAVLSKAQVAVLARLMDGEWHPTADMVASHKSLRVHMQRVCEALAPFGYEVQNKRANKSNRATGEHGYRLRRA